jgi:hypothetical protein
MNVSPYHKRWFYSRHYYEKVSIPIIPVFDVIFLGAYLLDHSTYYYILASLLLIIKDWLAVAYL